MQRGVCLFPQVPLVCVSIKYFRSLSLPPCGVCRSPVGAVGFSIKLQKQKTRENRTARPSWALPFRGHFWPLLATPGRGQTFSGAAAIYMPAPSSIDTGTPAPAIRLPLDPMPTHPREHPFSQESGTRLDLQARSSTMRRWTVAEEAGVP